MASVGFRFSTGNSVVKTLPVGAQLEVVGQGELQVMDLPAPPAPSFKPGDRVSTKYGPSTVVRFTSRETDLLEADDNGDVRYIADGTAVVRVAHPSDVEPLVVKSGYRY